MNKYLRKRERAKRHNIIKEYKEDQRIVKVLTKDILRSYVHADLYTSINTTVRLYRYNEEDKNTLVFKVLNNVYKNIKHIWYFYANGMYYISFVPREHYTKYYPKEGNN